MLRKAFSKVNLHLQVGDKTETGLHNILSLMQTIDLFDTINIEIEEANSNIISINGMTGPNTMEKAARLWLIENNKKAHINISIEKKIPICAGLGGPSTDAAQVLLALNQYFGINKDLNQLALRVGSDVPFFVSGYKAALVSGIGEKIEEVVPKIGLKGFVIIPKGQEVNTTWAFSELDNYKRTEFWAKDKILDMYKKNFNEFRFLNDFEKVNKPLDSKFLKQIDRNDCLFLSGSGSAWVLLTKKDKISSGNNNIYKISILS